MATIRKTGARWQAVIRRTGYPHQSRTFARRADAAAWASLIESEMDRGIFQDRSEADRLTLGDGLKKYGETVTPRKKGKKQELVRIAYWRNHRLARASVSRVTAKDLADWRDAEIARGLAAATVNNHLILLSHFFNHARKEWGLPVSNPVEAIWRPKLPKGRSRRISDDELSRLLDAAASVDALLPLAVRFAIETGLRRGELVNLRRSAAQGATLRLEDTKNGERRDVPLSKAAQEILEALPARIDGLVWPWTPDTLSHRFKAAVDAAGLEDLHFHDLRHEATSRLAKIYPVHELARITGHKTLHTLMRYYHPTADELAERLARA